MQTLHIFDEMNYDPSWKTVCREAVRAIIIKDGKIALTKSTREGFYKFPGGGIESGEAHFDTLVRETKEETGLHVIPESVKEYGMLWEIRRGLYGDEIFNQKSYYYFADVTDSLSAQTLDNYEADMGFVLEWADLEPAYQTNMRLGGNYQTSFIFREAYMLKQLLALRL